MKKLPPMQAAFVDEYLIDLNATAAAGRAGYRDPNYGRQLLANPNVSAAIADAIERRSKRTKITADRVLQELARIAFADMRRLFVWDEDRACYVPSRDLTEDEAAAVAAVDAETVHFTREDGSQETKIKLKLKTYDKLSALEKIGKHLGLFTDRVDVTSGGDKIQALEVLFRKPDAEDGDG